MTTEPLRLSTLPKTWIFDFDGTIVKHDGYWLDGADTLLDGVRDFLDAIPDTDMVVFITARQEAYRDITVGFLRENNIRYEHIIFDAPFGERIIINDRKPSGLPMAHAVNVDRDNFNPPRVIIDKRL